MFAAWQKQDPIWSCFNELPANLELDEDDNSAIPSTSSTTAADTSGTGTRLHK